MDLVKLRERVGEERGKEERESGREGGRCLLQCV